MEPTPSERTTVTLTEENPTYEELLELYNFLRTTPGETPRQEVTQHALAQVVGEMIDYLDFVSADIEKSIGLTQDEERRRLLAEFDPPVEDDLIERTAELVRQWRAVEQYSREELAQLVRQP